MLAHTHVRVMQSRACACSVREWVRGENLNPHHARAHITLMRALMRAHTLHTHPCRRARTHQNTCARNHMRANTHHPHACMCAHIIQANIYVLAYIFMGVRLCMCDTQMIVQIDAGGEGPAGPAGRGRLRKGWGVGGVERMAAVAAERDCRLKNVL